MIKFVGNGELYKNELYELSTINACLNWLKSLSEVNLDTETEGFFNHLNKMVMLQLNWKDITYVIDVRVINILILKDELERLLIVGQNLKFDYKFLKFYGIELNNIYDTMLAECCLTNGLLNRQLGLEYLALKYCDEKLDKGTRGEFTRLDGQPFTEKQIVYGVGDVECLTEIKTKQLIELEKLDLINWVNNEFTACLPLADIEYNGMGFNSQKWLNLAKKAKNNVGQYIEELDEFVRGEPKLSKFVKKRIQGNLFTEIDDTYKAERDIDILWSGPAQVSKVFGALGLKLESTSERFLIKHQNQYPLIKKFIDYKKQQKLVTTYGKKFLKYVNPNTNRVHTSFWQILDTSRVSSGSKRDGTPNMQNIPAKVEYRNCFTCRDGFKMCSVDFAGQELRLTAHGSKEDLWVNAFNNGEDLHSKAASMMFNISIEEVRDKPDFLRGKSYRDAAKNLQFGLVYGMSKFKLADTLNIDVNVADDMIKKYFKATPKLNNFLKEMRAYGIANGYIRSFSPYRIIRYFPQWREKFTEEEFKFRGEIERASMNTPIQASGGQMTKRALHLLRKYIKDNKLQDKVYLVMTVHDQIDCEVEENYVNEWSLIQKEIMEDAGRETIQIVPVISEITISDFWTK